MPTFDYPLHDDRSLVSMSTIPSPLDLSRKHARTRKLAALARYATVLLLLALFAATHYPTVEIPFSVSNADKIAHCLAYVALAFSALVSWDLTIGQLRPHHYFTVWLVGTLYAAFDEITQIPVGRHCDLLDWISDIAGIVLGLTVFRLSRSLLSRLIKPKVVGT